MFLSFFLGFLAGIVSLLSLGVAIFLYALDWIERQNKKALDSLAKHEIRDLYEETTIAFPCQKQGLVWILEREKHLKVNSDGSHGAPFSGSKEKKEKNNFVEVSTIKKHAKINYHTLILTGPEGSSAYIDLSNCTVISISSSNNHARKWAKRYPIKIQSKDASIKLYNGNNIVYLYADTSWEKESWCKALRLAATTDPKKLLSHSEMIRDYQNYLNAINAEYPSFIKPVSGSHEQLDDANRTEGPSRVRTFFKKFSKKATVKTAADRTLSENLRGSFQDLTSCAEAGTAVEDEGRLCLNLLLSRLFFDAQSSTEINNFIQSRIQNSLSGLRIPSYVGEITCTGFKLGRVPPHIQKMRAVSVELSELLAFEVDFDFTGGFLVNVETRLDIHAAELHKDFFEKGPESRAGSVSGSGSGSGSASGSEEEGSDLLEGLEHYGRQFRSANDLTPPQSEVAPDGLKHSKSANARASTYTSRWKNMLNSIATRVNQVPLSLAIRVNSIRGTLRCHIKPPPSDRLWYGFTSMPDIDWNIETSIAERRIASKNIASLLRNRFKAALCGTMVLPNCENIPIPGMSAERDDWAPRKTAPFIWVNHETTPDKLHEEPKQKAFANASSTVTQSDLSPSLDEKVESRKNTTTVQDHKDGAIVQPSSSSSYGTANQDLKLPLLNMEKQGRNTYSSETGSPVSGTNLPRDLSALNGEDAKKVNRRARMMDFGKRVGDKLGENRRKIEERSRNIVDKFRENMNTVQ